MTNSLRRGLSWLFRDRETGEITIAQAPNITLWIVLIGSAISFAWPPPGRWNLGLNLGIKIVLAIWALDEMLRGVNPWRRILGSAALIYALVTIRTLNFR